jgi:P4 family phage/plasmid primase-like protien
MTVDTFENYINSFKNGIDNSKNLTHQSFPNPHWGKYNVPESEYDNFYEMYFKFLQNGEQMFITEKINENVPFAFFLDIETPKHNNYVIKRADILKIIEIMDQCINIMFEKDQYKFNLCEHIITRRNNKFHINYYNLIVNTFGGQNLAKLLISKLESQYKKLIDTSVYRTAIRLFGSQKSISDVEKEKENFEDEDDYSSIYQIYDIHENELWSIEDVDYDTFKNLIVRRLKNTPLSIINTSFKESISIKDKDETLVKKMSNKTITFEIVKLMSWLKREYKDDLSQYLLNDVTKYIPKSDNHGILHYYININDKFCPFYGREHIRESSPIYIDLSDKGIFIKCHDIDCLRCKFPDEGFNLPDNFEQEYPELYLSMNTKYWKADIVLTEEIKNLLEDSLSGSHYKIAKAIFNIYKDRFRIDDIKNPDWYEFDGIRWNKTHIMNILISEEVHKYYSAIKISDTGVLQKTDLTNFIEKDQLESNMRNSLVDNIIGKLDNVSFKKNIIAEMHYLFKQHEPNFISKLDANPYLFGFKNGVYDLETCSFRGGNKNDYITLSTGYDYIEYDESDEEIQEIYTFLKQIIPNEKVFQYLLKILGRSLLGINDEKFYILTGLSGANGKSTLINFLEYALGDYITSADVSLLTNPRAISSSASPDVIRLKGKRLVSFAEPEYKDTLKTGIIKAFSGGDSIIARELYKAPISFKLQASMFMCTNDLPAINSCDGGTFRRLRIIEFTSRFCDNPIKENEFKIDPTIKTKIKNWRPYFMTILIHYYNVYTNEMKEFGKIEEPREVLVATNKYKKDNDKCNEYMTECIREDNNSFETLRSIYNNFMRWWNVNYINTKTPDIKELRKSLKIKYGNEIEVNGQVGFNITLNDERNTSIDDDIL